MARKYPVLFFYIFIIMTIAACNSYSEKNDIEFRLVLSPDEINGREFDIIKNGKNSLYISRDIYFTDEDFEGVDVLKSAIKANTFIIRLKFNKDGRKKFHYFVKKFPDKRVAIFMGGKLITAPFLFSPNFIGDKVVVKWPGSEKDLISFATEINDANPGVISLYIDEEISYTDVAAGAVVDRYSEFNRYVEERRRTFENDASFTEADREF